MQNSLEAIQSADSLLKQKNLLFKFLQGFAPGLALFSACINDLDDGIQNMLITFTDCTFLRRIERSFKDKVSFQNDLEKLI